MPTKKKTVYKTVPKPVKGIKKTIGCPVNCKECGTDDRFTLTAMLEHKLWCALAKKKNQETAAEKEKSQKRGPKRY